MIALAAIPVHRPCAVRSTVGGYEQWVRDHAVDGRIPQRFKPAMWRLEACQADGQPARLTAIRWRLRYLRGQAWDQTHPWLTALSSWYSDLGMTASGWHAADGVANLTLAFGTRVEFAYAGRTVVATVDDRGPAAWTGRTWDLAQSTAAALGFDGVAEIRYRVLP